MTGMSSRHPSKKTGEPVAGNEGDWAKDDSFPGVFFKPSFRNICLCYLSLLTFFLSPVALLFAFLFAERGGSRLQAHYFFIRTTFALLVIGFCLAGLMVVLGAVLSTVLILAGVVLFVLSAALTLVRCASGLVFALRSEAPRNYKSYLM
ncbi:hypothetical protein [Roseibium aggregatum]|uniref:Uncharacterized protein n=1 Tax=Roseibium aggregatum TaxID=187304 RepID=A0A939ECV7_9HYPH|nr:hypothetical protein [Roseibium aggregatum]MBN9669279.1 hypothetical protein [Roseibium aggregatum]